MGEFVVRLSCCLFFSRFERDSTSLANEAAAARPPTLKDCMGTPLGFESQVETPKATTHLVLNGDMKLA
jgi:hypothetical protein